MKKFILAITFICTLAFGFKGGCLFSVTHTGNNPLSALVSGMRYTNSEGFVNLYYVAAGAGGKIYTTTDPVNGQWIERSSGTSGNINYLRNTERSDTAVTFGVGDNGLIIRSLDQGETWIVLNSSVTDNLKSVDFIGSGINDIIAVGESGLIIKSTNGGENWSEIISGVTKNLNSVYSPNSFSMIIAGDNGTLLRSTNNGVNWENRSLADSLTDLNQIGLMGSWFFGDIYGIAGDDGRLYRSTNLLFWDSIYTGTDADLFDLKFRNASSGYICGENGRIQYTTDGGFTWFDDVFLQTITDDDIKSTLILNDTTAVGIAGNDIFVTYADETLLPVELTSFTSSVFRNNVNLKWTTASEQNNSGFDVERLVNYENGNSQSYGEWTNIGFINGNGTTSNPSDYEFTDKGLNTGTYSYRLKQTDYNGNFEYFNLMNEINMGAPVKFSLQQNYPNPFNPSTKIAFELPYESEIKLAIYDITGKEVEVLISGKLQAGFYEQQWDASGFSSGTYFYRIHSGSGTSEFTQLRKMLLVR